MSSFSIIRMTRLSFHSERGCQYHCWYGVYLGINSYTVWKTQLTIHLGHLFMYRMPLKILENLYAKIFLHNSGCLTIIPSSQFHPRSLFEFLQWRQNTCSVSYGMPHCSHLGSSSRSEIWCPFFFSSFACTSICRCRSLQVVMCLWLSDLLLSMIFSLFNNLYFSRGVVQLELSWSFQ